MRREQRRLKRVCLRLCCTSQCLRKLIYEAPRHLLCFECPRHLLWFDCASHSLQPINPIHTLPPTCPSCSIPATSAPPRSTLIHTPFNSLKYFVNPLHWMFSQRIGHFFTRKFGHGTNGRLLIQHMDMDGNATFFLGIVTSWPLLHYYVLGLSFSRATNWIRRSSTNDPS